MICTVSWGHTASKAFDHTENKAPSLASIEFKMCWEPLSRCVRQSSVKVARKKVLTCEISFFGQMSQNQVKTILEHTLESKIDVAPWINVAPGKFVKKSPIYTL